METGLKKKRTLRQRLHKKYRLVIMNDNTLEEKLSFRLTRMNVFIVVGAISIGLVILTTYLIAFTPLKEYIPDYASDVKMRQRFMKLSVKSDSLEKALEAKDMFLQSIRNVINGKDETEASVKAPSNGDNKSSTYNGIKNAKSEADSLLRLEIEKADQSSLSYDESGSARGGITDYFFFTPLKGIVSNGFNPSEKHYGIDIASKPDEAIKATLDGTVIYTGWSVETGYVIGIQHTGNLISMYMHNSALLKKQGAFVKAGEAIAIVGNSGKITTGPHLHFEIWYNGSPVNPKDYMVFK